MSEVLPVLGSVALCILCAWGFSRLGTDNGQSRPDPWQLAVGCVFVGTLMAWYTGLAGASGG